MHHGHTSAGVQTQTLDAFTEHGTVQVMEHHTSHEGVLGGWGSLVGGLIVLHLAAFAFWVVQVARSSSSKKELKAE